MSNSVPNELPAAKPPKRPMTFTIVLGSCALLILLCCGGTAAVIMSGLRAKDAAKMPAERFLTALERSDYGAIDALLAHDARTVSALRNVMTIVQKRYGKPLGHTGPTRYSTAFHEGLSQVTLSYSEQFEKGSIPFQFVVVSKHGAWRVRSFHLDI